jgi:hypothetical protein
MIICVHTSHSRRGDDEPHVFYIGGHRLIVADILRRWSQHPHRYFELVAEDGRLFVLRQDSGSGLWELSGVIGSPRHRSFAESR